mmetsp:Transcript_48628/g.95960  ORF Transcript_48628/g.95960 Transcript_48628/m.95960 type:complete len:130 (+) Transcript_48628:260-649(+)
MYYTCPSKEATRQTPQAARGDYIGTMSTNALPLDGTNRTERTPHAVHRAANHSSVHRCNKLGSSDGACCLPAKPPGGCLNPEMSNSGTPEGPDTTLSKLSIAPTRTFPSSLLMLSRPYRIRRKGTTSFS